MRGSHFKLRACRASRGRRLLRDPILNRGHFPRGGWPGVVESVQVQQAVHDVELDLLFGRGTERARLSARSFGADENFAVLKRDHVRRAGNTEKLPMQLRDAAI